MVLVKKAAKSVSTTIHILLEKKVKKVQKVTELSKYIWELKNNSMNYDLK